jgi:hypothetical protein
MPLEPITLPLQCAHCHGEVTLQMPHWPTAEADKPHPPMVSTAWQCPYCDTMNDGEFPGRLAWVTRREDDGAPVN